MAAFSTQSKRALCFTQINDVKNPLTQTNY